MRVGIEVAGDPLWFDGLDAEQREACLCLWYADAVEASQGPQGAAQSRPPAGAPAGSQAPANGAASAPGGHLLSTAHLAPAPAPPAPAGVDADAWARAAAFWVS